MDQTQGLYYPTHRPVPIADLTLQDDSVRTANPDPIIFVRLFIVVAILLGGFALLATMSA